MFIVEIITTTTFSENTCVGQYHVRVSTNGTLSYLSGQLGNTTINKWILHGLIEAVKNIPEPAEVTIISSKNLGERNKKGANADLKDLLRSALNAGGHTYNFEIDVSKCNELKDSLVYVGSDKYAHPCFSEAPSSCDEGGALKETHGGTDADWKLYILNPIDFGWEHLPTVEDTLKTIVSDEHQLSQSAHPYDIAYTSVDFKKNWARAELMAKNGGMRSDFRDEPSVFWLPNESCMAYAFVFKEEDNGTTYVISPVDLPWLNTYESTFQSRELLNNLVGSPKQINWATYIIEDNIRHLKDLALKIPSLQVSFHALCKMVRGLSNAQWIIEYRENLQFLTTKEKDGLWTLAPHSVYHHPLLQSYPNSYFEDLSPLLDIGNNWAVEKAIGYAATFANDGIKLKSCIKKACEMARYPIASLVEEGLMERLGNNVTTKIDPPEKIDEKSDVNLIQKARLQVVPIDWQQKRRDII